MSLVMTGFSVEELERFAHYAMPEMAEAAKRELDARGPRERDALESDPSGELFA